MLLVVGSNIVSTFWKLQRSVEPPQSYLVGSIGLSIGELIRSLLQDLKNKVDDGKTVEFPPIQPIPVKMIDHEEVEQIEKQLKNTVVKTFDEARQVRFFLHQIIKRSSLLVYIIFFGFSIKLSDICTRIQLFAEFVHQSVIPNLAVYSTILGHRQSSRPPLIYGSLPRCFLKVRKKSPKRLRTTACKIVPQTTCSLLKTRRNSSGI